MRFLSLVLCAALLGGCSGDDNNTSSNNTNNSNNASNNDVCAGVDCTAAIACDGQTVVESTGVCMNGTCVVEQGVTCQADEVCVDGSGCARNLCEQTSCEQPDDACNGDVATQYSGEGSCNPIDGVCDFAAVTMTVNCAMTNEVCLNGACVIPDPVPPTPGDLVITEIMNNPSQVAEVNGEWFELFNRSDKRLELVGLQIGDVAGVAFSITSAEEIVLEPNSYFVIGSNSDATANGGTPVDYEYDPTFFVMANDDDAVIVSDPNDVVLDRVDYVFATWGDSNGASMQFGAQNDAATDDNNAPQFWCISEVAYGDGDFGSPGAENADCN